MGITGCMNSVCEQNAQFLVLKQVVHVMTTVLDGVDKRIALVPLNIPFTWLNYCGATTKL